MSDENVIRMCKQYKNGTTPQPSRTNERTSKDATNFLCRQSNARARRTETETMADVSDYSEYDDSMMDDDDDGSDFYDSENPSPVVTKKKGGAAVRSFVVCRFSFPSARIRA